MNWQWKRALTSSGTFVNIPGATSDTYTPRGATEDDPSTPLVDESDPGDEGRFLEVTVTYRDDAIVDGDPDAELFATSANAVRVEPDVNAPPVFSASITREVAENTGEGGTVGGPVTASDPDSDIPTYSITGGADMGAFTIDAATGQIKVGKETKLDFEGSQRTYEVEVTATDPFGGTGSAMVTIMVTDVNEPPKLMTTASSCTANSAGTVFRCSYDENGTDPVADFTAMDPEGQGVEWGLNGADAKSFNIDEGVLTFKSPPNHEVRETSTR